MTTVTVSKEIELLGVYVEVEGEFGVRGVEGGFAYEYGSERGFHSETELEVDECEGCSLIGDVRAAVEWKLDLYAKQPRNRRFLKRARRLVRQLEAVKLDGDEIFDVDEVLKAAESYDI